MAKVAISFIAAAVLLAGCDGKHPDSAHSKPHRSSPQSAAAAPTAPSEIDKLIGAACYSSDEGSRPICQRGEAEGEPKKDRAATAAFADIFWSKMDKRTRTDASDRMGTVAPFSEGPRGVVTGFGCVPHDCGDNTINFYFERASGRIAFAITRDSVCQKYSEDGFKSVNLLCRG